MNNFIFENKTKVYFGKGGVKEYLGSLLVNYGETVMLAYGGGSIKRNGVYDEIMGILNAAGKRVVEFDRIMPNPTYAKAQEGAKLARENHVDLILAVGGGSVIDTAKAVAAGLEYEGDAWDFFAGRAQVEWALPVFAVLTIPAAGSEQSIRAVITHHGTKTGIGSEHIRPKAAFINPERFLTLPAIHISAGVCDMLSHICERYFSNTAATDFVDGQAEAALRTIIKFGPKVLADPSNYDAWCQIGLAGSFAHNGIFGLGREEDWACHAIEHEISGWNESIIHGCGLAVVMPAWMQQVCHVNPKRFADFARRVMGVGQDADDAAAAALGIEAFKAWLKTMKLPLTLQELGAVDCPIEALARHCCRKGAVGHFKPLEKADVEALLRAAQ